MKKKRMGLMLILAAVLLLCGCQTEQPVPETTQPAVVVETEPAPTVPPDGDPDTVTCKGGYTAEGDPGAVVASLEGQELTNSQLAAWYAAQIAQYKHSGREPAPDFSRPLDTQSCPIDGEVNSWQQYFLKQALRSWHTAQALIRQAQEDDLPLEEAYKPNQDNLDKYMTDMPASRYLYGYNAKYQPNTMHQAWLEEIPQLLAGLAERNGYAGAEALAAASGTDAEALEAFARDYNYAYMYYTTMGYALSLTQEEVADHFAQQEAAGAEPGVTRDSGWTVDIRQILLKPENGDWEACRKDAEALLQQWKNKTKETEAMFAEYAYRNTQDAATAASGGAYRDVRQGQLPEPLDVWCFDSARQVGDTAVLSTEEGVHILYFSGSTELWYVWAQEDLTRQRQEEFLNAARDRFPARIDYAAIVLPQAEAVISLDDVLYPDVAHERYPEVPLYLQQDYLGTWYGGFELRSHGCGITTFSMLSTYMTDTLCSPPMLCARYGSYCHHNGTDGMIFHNESPVMGFFLREKTYEFTEAKQALKDGYIVVSIQHKGYWTGGGHYILLEKITEDDMVQVRDSNIFNYAKIPAHKNDLHEWKNIQSAGSGYWIFEKKVTSLSFCDRCGDGSQSLLTGGYLCEKCQIASLRRDTYLAVT